MEMGVLGIKILSYLRNQVISSSSSFLSQVKYKEHLCYNWIIQGRRSRLSQLELVICYWQLCNILKYFPFLSVHISFHMCTVEVYQEMFKQGLSINIWSKLWCFRSNHKKSLYPNIDNFLIHFWWMDWFHKSTTCSPIVLYLTVGREK